MLYEIDKVQQHNGEDHRRWFFDKEIDLLVWFDKDDNINGFQLCYNKTTNPHAITWLKDKEYKHNRVDFDDNTGGSIKGIAILVADGVFDYKVIAEEFKIKSSDIPSDISKFVYEKILAYKP